MKTPEEFACEMKLYARDTRHIRLKSLDDLKEVMEMNRGQQSDQLRGSGQQNAGCKPLEVLRSLPLSSHPDTLMVIMDTKESEPDVSWQPQRAGLGSILR